MRGLVINRFRGDPALLFDGCAELERRCGVPTLGVIPMVEGTDYDAEDSLALDRWATATTGDGGLDVAVVRFPRIANFGDLDPLRLEPSVAVRWVRTATELSRPHLIVLPGSKATRADLASLHATGLPEAVAESGVPVVAICAGLQMAGQRIDDPLGVEGPPGSIVGLGWLPVTTTFEATKALDRPSGSAIVDPGAGEPVIGYRIHHGRVRPENAAEPWLTTRDGATLGWRSERVLGTTLHGLFENDRLRARLLRWAAERAGLPSPEAPAMSFACARAARLDRIADTLETHLDLERVFALLDRRTPLQASNGT